MKTPLDIAIQIVGGQSALAAKVGVKQGNVWYWLNRQGGMSPPEKVLAVCEATDWQVTPHELRPDIYPNPTDGLPAEKSGEAA